jgi:hypothetical protein
MGADDGSAFARLPLAADAKGNETAAIAGDKVLFPALDLIGPGLALREFLEAGLCEDLFGRGDGVERRGRGVDERNQVFGVRALRGRQRRHGDETTLQSGSVNILKYMAIEDHIGQRFHAINLRSGLTAICPVKIEARNDILSRVS